MRAEFTRVGLKMWVSSRVKNWRLVLELNPTSLRLSGELYTALSPRYVAARLSLSEILISPRVVKKKFSLTTCWPAKLNIPRSPFDPALMPPLGRDQKGRYF